ncbi:hypothetical protein Poli38472_008160 [Pythium oligandrum]|uniref:NADP-dependent oxidoreductase domain-containing protein n=1 Tax=Pythium oligandrum TaxID=41045 RepID=A0A8K1FPD8_PYTOL|nr:hypothetical protein Poli38472_008160 [Pythium oligandrum]|eukprot:TMW65518.1 hypothetical protein Poli38472_008160 [Pythium oligandrum]
MQYRFLGNSGLLVSQFSYGCFMTMERQLDFEQSLTILERAFQLGVNFFDNAEIYANGTSEQVLGRVIKAGIERGTWTREDLVISTKMFFGSNLANLTGAGGLNKQGLSRKHIVEGVKASLERLQLDYVDLLFCHRPDPCTPIEETVRAMNYAIEQGWAFYWGTSEWSAGDILEACEIADRLGLIRPIFEQVQYNVFERSRVEYEYAPLYQEFGYGTTTFSPLACGVLTGKYSKGIPEGTRLSIWRYKHLQDVIAQQTIKAVRLEEVAQAVGCSLPQLALAWCAANNNVSSVLFSATSVEQLEENLKAAEFVHKITPEIKAKIDEIVDFQPKLIPRYHEQVIGVRGRYMNA